MQVFPVNDKIAIVIEDNVDFVFTPAVKPQIIVSEQIIQPRPPPQLFNYDLCIYRVKWIVGIFFFIVCMGVVVFMIAYQRHTSSTRRSPPPHF